MFKKALVMMLALAAVPTFALADWSINASTQPANLTVAAPATAAGVTTGKATRLADSVTEAVFTVATAPGGYTLSYVKINGVVAASPYTVSQGVPNSTQVIVAYYAPITASTFSVKSIAAAGGWISRSQSVGSGNSATFTVVANAGHTLTDVLVNGVSTGDVDGSVTVGPVTANSTIQPVFTAVKALQASIGIPAALSAAPGSTLNLIANTVPGYTNAVYTWGGTCAQVAGADSSKRVVTAPATGEAACTVTLQAVADGMTATTSSTITPEFLGAFSCLGCHDGSGGPSKTSFTGSAHDVAGAGCAGCHNPNNDLSHAYKPLAEVETVCTTCHTDFAGLSRPMLRDATLNCAQCHTKSSVHSVKPNNQALVTKKCIECHNVALPAHPNKVADNNGVRAITTEFAKWSHHVTGVDLNDAHCAACHLEGKVVGNAVVIDTNIHMADSSTHLRDADNDSDRQWTPASPDHSIMDTFCMSCHDANGATSAGSVAIQALINTAAGAYNTGKTASATNPFGDTISNRYDKMQRPAVVNVSSQFDTTNPSHHAVKGKRYTGRTVEAGDRQIADVAGLQGNVSTDLPGTRSTIYDNVNPITGTRNTIFNNGVKDLPQGVAFNQLYVPLENAVGEVNVAQSLNGRTGSLPLGDDSTLHCGDCHTVGQFKVGSATNADGSATTAVIGAHGSENEYMLRNTSGTDARHTQNTYTISSAKVVTNINSTDNLLVCFNCHAFQKYGSAYQQTGVNGSHAGEYATGGRCNGSGNTLSFNGYTTGTETSSYVPGVNKFINRLEGEPSVLATGENAPDMAAVFGIQCANCHNSGLDNGYGGIHGSAVNTYTDGMGNTTKHERFMPGLGNVMYVPGTQGGFTGASAAFVNGSTGQTYQTGGVSNDTNWEQQAASPATNPGAGCYTLGNFVEIDGTVQKPYTNAVPPSLKPEQSAAHIKGQSVDGGLTTPDAVGTWGGCYDHAATPAKGTGANKQIIRPVTY
ncbi:MAG: cytochrome c3 family protein [Desulfuromonadaceae bacterium]|nr:cytochrome c3 family protein [Desulfuromonadaceae bacterium]MDD5106946.1 cytochrome c3 family protein [Desulfuromonadaceae bacterium]